jgi:peptidyl-prolyl cis-trans isomerase C
MRYSFTNKDLVLSFKHHILKAGLLTSTIFCASQLALPSHSLAEEAKQQKSGDLSKTELNVVATYDNIKITESDLQREIDSKPAYAFFLQQNPSQKDELRKTALTAMINRSLLLKDTKTSKSINEQDIQASIQNVVTQYGGKDKLSEMLKSINSTYDKFTADIADDFRLQAYIEKNIVQGVTVTDEEAKKEFDTNSTQYKVPAQVNARHILVRTTKGETDIEAKKKAQSYYEEAQKKGADFGELAKKYSQDSSASKGGELGFFTYDMMVPEFSKAAFALKKGEISQPVLSKFGYHIIKVEDKKEEQLPTYETAKDDIKRALLKKKKDILVNKWIENLRQKANVKTFI